MLDLIGALTLLELSDPRYADWDSLSPHGSTQAMLDFTNVLERLEKNGISASRLRWVEVGEERFSL